MSIQEIILIALVLLVLFGAKRIPGMMKNIGKGISEFNSEKIQNIPQIMINQKTIKHLLRLTH
jgi:sec-independent protein translocase protein TatA